MLRAAIIFLAIPTVCDPPAEPPPYECRALPSEIDFGEVQSFTRATKLLALENRDRPHLGPLSEPFDARLTSAGSLALALQFTPADAQLHFDSLAVRLHPDCDEQLIRLTGRGSGALETPKLELDFGEAHRFQPVEVVVPLINTRREPVSVSSSSVSNNRLELDPGEFAMQPFERREVTVRLTCLREGRASETLQLITTNQTLSFRVTGDCVP
ncbi:MAG: hypothetical protein QM817_23110 [Archangium sp.]